MKAKDHYLDPLATVETGSWACRVMGQRLFNRNALLMAFTVTILAHQVLLALGHVVASAHRRQQIDNKGENVASEDERNDPLEHCAGVLFRCIITAYADTEANRESDFNNDEGELYVEAGEQDAVLTTIEDADAEVLGAN